MKNNLDPHPAVVILTRQQKSESHVIGLAELEVATMPVQRTPAFVLEARIPRSTSKDKPVGMSRREFATWAQ